jgi:hypothetical protein
LASLSGKQKHTLEKVVEKKEGSMDPKRKEHFKVECMHAPIYICFHPNMIYVYI